MAITIQFIGKRPEKAHDTDAGWDLFVEEDTIIPTRKGVNVPSGLMIALPPTHWGRITGRSSTLHKRGLLVMEGVIDSGYRGPLFAHVTNLNSYPVTVRKGDRIAQLLVHESVTCEWVESKSLDESPRGGNGFGSSGS